MRINQHLPHKFPIAQIVQVTSSCQRFFISFGKKNKHKKLQNKKTNGKEFFRYKYDHPNTLFNM